MKTRVIIEYLLAAVIVLVLGSLAGWYFFLRTQTETTLAQNIARGFGSAIPVGNPNGSISSASPSAPEGTPATPSSTRPPQLWRIEGKPVAGQAFVGYGAGLRIRYVERASGYVLDANPETGQVTRLTNTLMPKIYEALLSNSGHIFERSLDATGNISTFAGTIATSSDTSTASTSAMTLSGRSLAKNMVTMSVHPTSGALLSVIRNSTGSAVVSAEWNGEKQKTLLESAMVSWRPIILEDGRTFLVQAAADGVPGYAYELKKDGALSLLLGPVPGLIVRVRPAEGADAKSALLWSQSSRGELRLFARVGDDATAVQLPIRTIAEKCAWSPEKEFVAYCGVPQGSTGQKFLDNWYRGAVHSSDALWRIDASAGTAELIYTPPTNTPVDIENVSVDRTSSYITFMNAADKSLWLFRLTK